MVDLVNREVVRVPVKGDSNNYHLSFSFSFWTLSTLLILAESRTRVTYEPTILDKMNGTGFF